MCRLRSVLSLTLAALSAGACANKDATAPVAPFNVSVINYLDANLVDAALTVDSLPYGFLSGSGAQDDFQVAGNAQSLTYTINASAARLSAVGAPQQDIIGVTGPIPLGGGVLTISATINGITYFAPTVVNQTTEAVYLGIFRSGSIKCFGELDPSLSNALGYFQLASDTELRAYHSAGCTGNYFAWTHAQITPADPLSGEFQLALLTAP